VSAKNANRLTESGPNGDATRAVLRAQDDHAKPASGVATEVSVTERLGQLLIEGGSITTADFASVFRISRERNDRKSVSRLLVELGMVSEGDMAEAQAVALNLPLARSADYPKLQMHCEPLSLRFLKQHCVVPIDVDDGVVKLAMADANDDYAVHAVQYACEKPVNRWIGIPSEIDREIERVYGEGKSAMGRIVDEAQIGDDIADVDVEQLKDMASEAPVIRLVNLLLQRAAETGASDVHIEPFEGRLKVRYRIDGVLHEVEAPPQKLTAAIISRIKIMAKLNIAERRLPQDGRVKLRIQGRDLDMRISTVPTMYGESVAIRLLNRGDVALDLPSLGFADDVSQAFVETLALPHGMILVTGPTGSGKTTTLYTAINILNTEERKIITAEDPVEYQMEGINQIQVKPTINLTFANALRSIVRQDPDVILVGEMRDLETARICIQSALTGHLVLSTLHTNSAASSITRLLEMGVDDYLLTSTVSAVISQRLVRKLCEACRRPYVPSVAVVAELNIERLSDGDEITLYRAGGCPACNGTGYRGRKAILEMLVMTDEIRQLVMDHTDAKQIQLAAVQHGMRTTYQDGCAKALAGITSIEEVLRVVQEI
jgi:general secretion pathway protein E